MRSRRRRRTGRRRARGGPAPSRPRRTARAGWGRPRRRRRAPTARPRSGSAAPPPAGGERRLTGGRGQRPGAVPPDLDRLRLVAVGVESFDDRTSRRERDLVLARPPAREHRDAHARAHGVVVVVGRVVPSRVVSRRHVDADEERHDRVRVLLGVARRILRDHDAVERLDVGVLGCHADLEPGRRQRRLRVRLGLAGDVGQGRRLGAVRDRER